MSSRVPTQTLRRRQLDRALTGSVEIRSLQRPARGWIHEIRMALGMSAAQLAARMGTRQSTVAKMERTEEEEGISLQSLRRAAEALDCTLVYAFVPNESLEATLKLQALRRAEQMVGRVERSMALEEQSRDREVVAEEVDELAAEFVRTLSREIWREEAKR
ncbi:MAG: mobile mystery protein A [Armatimonadetes bacterium]|nr:mobile mystery protein A [Armatimonadota bacterium]